MRLEAVEILLVGRGYKRPHPLPLRRRLELHLPGDTCPAVLIGKRHRHRELVHPPQLSEDDPLAGDHLDEFLGERVVGAVGAMRVFKGHALPGRMGRKRVTVQNLEVVRVDAERNLLLIKGSVPGPNNGYVIVKSAIKSKSK